MVTKGKKNLYLFDFDGTLTKVDTLFDFLKYSFPLSYKKAHTKFLFQFVLAKLKLRSPGIIKQNFIASFLEGKSKSEIEGLALHYFQNRKAQILRAPMVEFLEQIDKSDEIYIVSASLDIWLTPFAESFGAKLICTKAEFTKQGIFTGRFATPNCNYKEKKRRILEEIDIHSYGEIFAFGDSKGDAEMFSLASKSFYKRFH